MGISDKTRKILWGRSGNRCAICRKELVLGATLKDDPSIVGEECHIVSGQVNGPRHDNDYPIKKINSYENLILLCRVHHKMIDDQNETYTKEILTQIKRNHEMWVSEQLNSSGEIKPVKIRRVDENIPEYLFRICSGKELINISNNICAFSFNHDDLNDNREVDLISSFAQNIQNLIDIEMDLEAGDRVRASYEFDQLIKEVEELGFWIFAGKENQIIEGGKGSPNNWQVLIINVIRSTNDTIIKLPLA